jgi:hypothetical protein
LLKKTINNNQRLVVFLKYSTNIESVLDSFSVISKTPKKKKVLNFSKIYKKNFVIDHTALLGNFRKKLLARFR